MKNNLEKFIGLYHMDKTLRFELKPMGKTLENINNNGFIENDNHRADSYKKVKKCARDLRSAPFANQKVTPFGLRVQS